MSSAISSSGMWWIWMFWRVVMWPLLSGAHRSTTSASLSICSGRDAAHRKLDPAHLHVGLALAVDALLQPEADEVVLGRLTVQELARLGVEVVELPLDDRDQVARDVVVDLWVLERAQASLALLLLALLLVELVRRGLVFDAYRCGCRLHDASYYINPDWDSGF